MKVFLGDMESDQLRKYASIFMKYKSFNVWSPPEVLLQINSTKRRVAAKETLEGSLPSKVTNNQLNQSHDYNAILSDRKAIDIYSLGMLLWELETE
jgi:hypothetical protein